MDAIAVVADVKGSRRRQDRGEWGERLAGALTRLNKVHRRELLGTFDVSKGVDEFAGLLRPDARAGLVLWTLLTSLHPVPVRVGMTGGDVDVIPTKRATLPSARLFDGPAFHAAARGLREAESSGRLIHVHLPPPGPDSESLGHITNLLYALVLSWTPRQLTLFQSYHSTHSQTEVARAHGISQPSVSQALARTQARLVGQSLDHLVDTMVWRGAA